MPTLTVTTWDLAILIGSLILVGTSLMTVKASRPPDAALIWSRDFRRHKSIQLGDLPWYRNYRYQSAGLLFLSLIIVAAWS